MGCLFICLLCAMVSTFPYYLHFPIISNFLHEASAQFVPIPLGVNSPLVSATVVDVMVY